MKHRYWLLNLVFALAIPCLAQAQSADETDANAEQVSQEDLLTQAELENLVAPVALYPDTLLIQILVAATNPMQVVKSDRLLADNEGAEPEIIQAAVEAEEWDESVEVLSVAFPEVIEDMALHIEWTETMGDAMLAQTDDVMAAVQTMRTQAINAGSLVTGEQQVVEVTEEEDVIIQPADPEVVYVPQYDPEVVYVDNSNVVGDAFTAGLIAFGTFAVIDAIFDDDDDWNDYWGCRNCGGWGGGPIYRNPDIDIDVDGNVNIGNKEFDRGDRDIDLGDRDTKNNVNIGDRDRGDRREDGGWKPDDRRKNDARDKISSKRDDGGKTKLPVNKKDNRSDDLRNKLSSQSGAPDISRPGSAQNRDAIRKTKDQVARPNVNRPAPSKSVDRKASKPAVKKPSGTRNHVNKASKPAAKSRPKATHQRSGGAKARASSNRGRSSGRKMKRRG